MIDYKVFDPNGNITVLVSSPVNEKDRVSIANEIMKKEPTAEQVGFISYEDKECDTVLNMAGGEFCGNATLCAAVNYSLKTGATGDIRVKTSGCEEVLTVNVNKNSGSYIARTNMPNVKSYSVKNLEFNGSIYTVPVVDLGAISHGIIIGKMEDEIITSAIKKWCNDLGASAFGLMQFSEEENYITPVVYVKNADTLFYENSCASGTTAIGCYLYKKYNKPICINIFQPGGKLNIKVESLSKIWLTGEVSFAVDS